MWLEQDGTTCHTASKTMNRSRSMFTAMTNNDYTKPNTVEQRKNNIREAIQDIPPESYQILIENVIKRSQVFRTSRWVSTLYHNMDKIR